MGQVGGRIFTYCKDVDLFLVMCDVGLVDQ